jgi:BirA family biotin operon repressor/biotin-[acetyl-CoA-carboxylase] ligase
MADGEFHSGETLAKHLDVSRAAVWKLIQQMSDVGVHIDSVKGKGYRMRPAIELHDMDAIQQHLIPQTGSELYRLDLLPVTESTNAYLKQIIQNRTQFMEFSASGQPAWACLAEYQTQGRGRRGRHWIASFGGNICLSVLWRFEKAPMELNGLSLVLGVAVADALKQYGIDQIQLKWPNDLYWDNRKLGGLLFEVSGEDAGPSIAIAGIGINVNLHEQHASDIEQPWVDIREISGQNPGMRNRLAAYLLNSVCNSLATFDREGVKQYVTRWREYDLCFGRPIELLLGKDSVQGVAKGIDDNGYLIVETGAGTQVYHSGEVSLRLSA